jgi:hypothetical protein
MAPLGARVHRLRLIDYQIKTMHKKGSHFRTDSSAPAGAIALDPSNKERHFDADFYAAKVTLLLKNLTAQSPACSL